MRQVVVDASAMMSWLSTAQATPASLAMLAALDSMALSAPAIFAWEVENALLTLHRGQRLSAHGHAQARIQLETLRVALAAPVEPTQLVARALKLGLSLFDCAYLDLAETRSASLATRDAGLIAVAEDRGVEVIDLRRPAH